MDGVFESDDAVEEALATEIKQIAAVLESTQGSAMDWHPGSDRQVLDLLHPSLFCYVAGKSLPRENYCSREVDEPDLTSSRECESEDPENAPDRVTRCPLGTIGGKFQWLPSIFNVHLDRTVSIESYISGLEPTFTAGLAGHKYNVVARLFEKFLPLFERVLYSIQENQPRRMEIPNSCYRDDFWEVDGNCFFPPNVRPCQVCDIQIVSEMLQAVVANNVPGAVNNQQKRKDAILDWVKFGKEEFQWEFSLRKECFRRYDTEQIAGDRSVEDIQRELEIESETYERTGCSTAGEDLLSSPKFKDVLDQKVKAQMESYIKEAVQHRRANESADRAQRSVALSVEEPWGEAPLPMTMLGSAWEWESESSCLCIPFETQLHRDLQILDNAILTKFDCGTGYDDDRPEHGSVRAMYRKLMGTAIGNITPFVPPPQSAASMAPKKVSLAGRRLRVITKASSIKLTPEKPNYPGGSWHVEGEPQECIVATGVYYVDCDNITESSLRFRVALEEGWSSLQYDQDDHSGVAKRYGLSDGDTITQPIGNILCSAYVFPRM